MKFHPEVPLSEEAAYRIICLKDADEGARNAVSARGWLKYSSYMRGEHVTLDDGSRIYRDGLGYLRILWTL